MSDVRRSTPADIPALRELWALAFGDSGPYVDNFFHRYYRPDRVFVLEQAGQVRSMTAWFDTTFVVPGQGAFRAAYLYAVATHPDCRGRGLAGALLAGADCRLRELDIPAVTTVPARPDLHPFFTANGFAECFVLTQHSLSAHDLPVPAPAPLLAPVTPAQYGAAREQLLSGTPHIAYPEEALAYQQGCCALSGGGLYAGDTPQGPVCLCVEGGENGLMVVKELLGSPTAADAALSDLFRVAPAPQYLLRRPCCTDSDAPEPLPFAMLKWLDPRPAGTPAPFSPAYLGLAFD